MVVYKTSSKNLDINCRHSAALTGIDRHRKRVLMALFLRMHDVLNGEIDENRAAIAIRFMRRISGEFMAVATIPRRIYIGYVGERLSIDSNLIEEGKIAADYRFKSRNQLHRLLTGFRIPAYFVIPDFDYRFAGEELLLIALERCALGSRYLDLQEKYKIHHSTICRGVIYFARWMNENWGYLLRDHFEFWGNYLEESRDAIKAKMLSHYGYDVDEDIDEEFLVELFIDCTIIPSCRTGGGANGTRCPRR